MFVVETEEGFLMLFSRRLGFTEDIEPAEEVRTEIQSTQEQEDAGDDGSPEVQNIRHLMKVTTVSVKRKTFFHFFSAIILPFFLGELNG